MHTHILIFKYFSMIKSVVMLYPCICPSAASINKQASRWGVADRLGIQMFTDDVILTDKGKNARSTIKAGNPFWIIIELYFITGIERCYVWATTDSKNSNSGWQQVLPKFTHLRFQYFSGRYFHLVFGSVFRLFSGFINTWLKKNLCELYFCFCTDGLP